MTGGRVAVGQAWIAPSSPAVTTNRSSGVSHGSGFVGVVEEPVVHEQADVAPDLAGLGGPGRQRETS